MPDGRRSDPLLRSFRVLELRHDRGGSKCPICARCCELMHQRHEARGLAPVALPE